MVARVDYPIDRRRAMGTIVTSLLGAGLLTQTSGSILKAEPVKNVTSKQTPPGQSSPQSALPKGLLERATETIPAWIYTIINPLKQWENAGRDPEKTTKPSKQRSLKSDAYTTCLPLLANLFSSTLSRSGQRNFSLNRLLTTTLLTPCLDLMASQVGIARKLYPKETPTAK